MYFASTPRGRQWPSPWRVSLFAAAPLVALAIIVLILSPVASRIVFNRTASQPRGLYWLSREAPHRGAFVVLDAPPAVAGLIAERHYLPASFRLLKQVVAVAGDHVCTAGGTYVVNGVPNARVATVDCSGRPLPAPYSFCGVVPTGAVWVAGRGATSLDSRFFGPVSLDKLTTAVPLWTTSFSR